MLTFYKLLANTLIAVTTNNFVWFAVTFWAYLETQSVLATSIIAGVFLVNTTLSGFWLGSIVDHYKKKLGMLFSSGLSLFFFVIGFAVFLTAPEQAFSSISSYWLWSTVLILMLGVTAGNIRSISISATTTMLIEADKRDRANGMTGTIIGVSFAITSLASGLVLGFSGMFWVLAAAIVFTIISILHLLTIKIPEKDIEHTEENPKKLDLKGTFAIVAGIPGMFALIFFTTFNNFLGGVFMSLMDAYGLSLVSVQTWGALWGFLSLGFIIGGWIIAKRGLGKNPLKTLFLVNIAMWISSIFIPIQPSIVYLVIGMFVWIILVPVVEATEQTIIQKVVPLERQGRVFGFAQSIEMAAAPISAFMIGPIAQFIFIPFMTTGRGPEIIGSWFGSGPGRGIALVFISAGIVGLVVTLIAMRSKAYKLLFERYNQAN